MFSVAIVAVAVVVAVAVAVAVVVAVVAVVFAIVVANVVAAVAALVAIVAAVAVVDAAVDDVWQMSSKHSYLLLLGHSNEDLITVQLHRVRLFGLFLFIPNRRSAS